MREEDIARAYAELLRLHEDPRAQIARTERQVREGEARQARFDLEKERAVRELTHVQEDLVLSVGRLDKGEEKGGEPCP